MDDLTDVDSRLPPIIRCEKDRQFLKSLYKDIMFSLELLEDKTSEQIYIIYKEAFDKLIGYVSAYKPLLTSIKAEYEHMIETIKRGHFEAVILQDQLQALAFQPSTLENYSRRTEELKEKLSIIEKQNIQLQEEINSANDKMNNMEHDCEHRIRKIEEDFAKKKEIRRDPRIVLPGLTVEQMTDKNTLIGELKQLESVYKGLVAAKDTKFATKKRKQELNDSLVEKLNQIDELRKEVFHLRNKHEPLEVAIHTAKEAVKLMQEQPYNQNAGEAVMKALIHSRQNDSEKPLPASLTVTRTDLSEVPGETKESNLILDYLEHFNKLMNQKEYSKASLFAANSPRGVLRTMEIFQRFREADLGCPSQMILLYFCECLTSTAGALDCKLPVDLSFECVQCALDHERLDLVEHWITNDRLSYCEYLGDLLLTYSTTHPHGIITCLDMAQYVFEECLESLSIKQTEKSVECLLRAGRYRAAVARAKQSNHFSDKHDYLKLIESYPSAELVLTILTHISGELWPAIVRCLKEQNQIHLIAVVLPDWFDVALKNADPNVDRGNFCRRLIDSETTSFWSSVLACSNPTHQSHQEIMWACINRDSEEEGTASVVKEMLRRSTEHLECISATG